MMIYGNHGSISKILLWYTIMKSAYGISTENITITQRGRRTAAKRQDFSIHDLEVVNAVFLRCGGAAYERRGRGYSLSSSSAETAARRGATFSLETARRSRATIPRRTSWRSSKTSSAPKAPTAAAGPVGEGAATERRVRTASAMAAA
jgi:hypothetical protein